MSAALITSLGSLLAIAAGGHQPHLLAAELDLKLIAGLEAEHGGVGLAHQQVAVALHGGHVAELAARCTRTLAAARTQVHTLGLQESLVEGGEVQALIAILLGAHIAAGAHEIRFGGIAEFFDLGEQIGAGKHRKEAASVDNLQADRPSCQCFAGGSCLLFSMMEPLHWSTGGSPCCAAPLPHGSSRGCHRGDLSGAARFSPEHSRQIGRAHV